MKTKDWRLLTVADAVLINPTVSMRRGKRYPFVEMAAVEPSRPSVGPSEVREFKGGGSRFEDGDTLFARITPCLENGKIARYRSDSTDTPAHGSTEFIVLRGRDGVTTDDFAFHLAKSPSLRAFAIGKMTGSSGRQRVPTDAFDHFTIAVPPLPEQKAIAAVLGALDDKIEQNRRTSSALELLARGMFRAWFVDFEPVKAKAAGQTAYPGMTAAAFAQLPTTFTDSQLGPVPKGWEFSKLGDVVEVLETGRRPKGGVKGITSGVPSIGAESITRIGEFDVAKTKYVPSEFFAAMRKGILEDRDVLLYKDGGRPGDFQPHVSMFGSGFPFDRMCINEHVFRIRAAKPLTQSYLYLWMSSDGAMDEMRSRGTGAAIPGLSSIAAKEIAVLKPSDSAARAIEALVEPLLASILAGAVESRRLAALRDYLLPKLLSGEVRVSGII